MKLAAEILTGRLFYVEVEEESTVGDLKKQIGNQENLPSDRLILMLDADQRDLMNDDDVSLKEYGVQDGSHIYVFFRLVDDGSPESPSTPPESVLFNESCSTFISVSKEPDPSEEPENELDPLEEPANELDPSEKIPLEQNPSFKVLMRTPPDIDFSPDFPSPSTTDPSDQDDVSPYSPSPSTTDPSDQNDE